MNNCQAPGMDCEQCRLKCQLPLIAAEIAQRERQEVEAKDDEP